MIRVITIELDRTEPVQSHLLGWLFSTMVGPPPNPPPFTPIPFFRKVVGEPGYQEPGPQEAPFRRPSSWIPAIPSPSPFVRNLLGNAIVPRVPLRIPQAKDLSKLGAKSNPADLKYAQKVDPRSVRFTEIVETVINSLLRSGSVFSTGNGNWNILFAPRQCTDMAAFNDEIYYSTTTLSLSYKDPGGVIHSLLQIPLTVGVSPITGGASGRVLYDNAGVLGEMTTTGAGTQLVLSAGPTMTGTIGAASWTIAASTLQAVSFGIKNSNGITVFASSDNVYADSMSTFGTRTDVSGNKVLFSVGGSANNSFSNFAWAPNAANTTTYTGAGIFMELNAGGSNSGGTAFGQRVIFKETSVTGLVARKTFSSGTGTVSSYTETFYVSSAGDIGLPGAGNLVLDTSTGTKIGTAGGAAGQKLGFFNATPVVQQLLATGAGHTVDDVITVLQTLGLCRQT